MLQRKNTFIFTLMLSMALFLSACAFQADPSLLTQDAEGASGAEDLPEIPDQASNELIAPYLAQTPIPIEGSMQKQTIDGPNAGEQTFFVYLPPAYDSGDQSYRTLYHLHGAGVQESWAGYDCTFIGSKVEQAVAAGIIDPMIVVCLVDPEANSMWSDSFDDQHLISTGFTQDLIPHIDATYRTIPERHGRALQGFSMGGFGTVVNGFRSPELFNAIVVWDGALHFWQSISQGRQEIVAKMFETETYFNEWSPWAVTTNATDADLDMFIVAGNMEIVRAFNDRFRPHLESVGQEFTYFDAPDCPHSIFCLMDAHGEAAFTFLADSFANADKATAEISAEMPYETQFVEILGSQMAYVEAGEGDPILFIHGNPTSKYLWRNIMPHLEDQGWVIALDLIGMGESDKPDIGYTFADHAAYLEEFITKCELENVTLVIHDWGSGLGFDYANRNPENVKAIVFMEAAIGPNFPPVMENLTPQQAQFIQAMRTEGIGEDLMLNKNMFIEQFLPSDVIRGLTDDEMAVYRAPYPDENSRIPLLTWVRQIPIGGEPAEVAERVEAYQSWFLTSELPKLHLYASPGALNPPSVAEYFQAQSVPNYESVFIGEGNHFIQEDQPHAIGQSIAAWYRRINQ